MNSPIKLVNNLFMVEPGVDNVSRNFEMALAQSTNITAGRYTFTPGAGWGPNPSLGWDQSNSTFGFGTYTYVGDLAFNPLTFDWSSVFNYADNATNCSAPPGSTSQTREDHGIYNGLDSNGNPVGGSCFNKP